MRRWPLLLLALAVACSGGRHPAHDAAADRSEDRASVADSASADRGALDQAVDADRADSSPDGTGADRPTLDQAENQAGPDSRRETGAAERPPDQATCYENPRTPETCAQSTCVRLACDYSFPLGVSVHAPTSGPMMAEIRSLRGPCSNSSCSGGCSLLWITPNIYDEPDGGVTCDILAISVDGRSEAFSLAIVRKPNPLAGSGMCCGRGNGTGYWYVEPETYRAIEPSSVQLGFIGDAGADGARDSSQDRDSKTDSVEEGG